MRTLLLITILLLSLFLRLFLLDKIPVSLNWDEAAFGYNAFSILETGKDEYGENLPLIFKSIGDYKNPLLVYLLVPFIKIFGLNEWGVRLPAAILGSLTVLVAYGLVNVFFKSSRWAVIAALLLAISPWHLQFSRAGLELPISMFLITLGIYLFGLSIYKSKYFLILSSIAFGVCFYSYYADRVLLPLLGLMLVIIYRKELLKIKKLSFISAVIFLMIILPLVGPFLSEGSQQKTLNTTIFGYNPPGEQLKLWEENSIHPIVNSVFNNNLVRSFWMMANRYLNHFSPSFLYLNGVEDKRQFIYGMGMTYVFEIPLLLFGIYNIFYLKGKNKYMLIAWLMLSPIPAAITRDETHARRAFQMLAPLVIIEGLGMVRIVNLVSNIKSEYKKITIVGISSLIVFFSITYYLLSYYIFTPLKTFEGAGGWQYGYKQLVEVVSPIKNNYQKVIIDNSYQGPYIFFLFYEKYPPIKYQPQANLVYKCPTCLGEGGGYDNFIFKEIYWPFDRSRKKTLFAGPPNKIPEQDIEEGKAAILQKIYFPDGRVAFLVVETF